MAAVSAVRAVVIGGDAAGMSAATRIRATDPDAEVDRARGRPVHQLLGVRHPVRRGRRGGRRCRGPRRPEPARSTAGGASTCACTTRPRPSTSPPARSRCTTGTPARYAGSGYDELLIATGGAPDPTRPARHRPAVHPRRADARGRRGAAGAGERRLPAHRHRRRRLHRPGDGRGLHPPRAARRPWSSGAPTCSVCSTATSASASATRCAATASTCASRRPSPASSPRR